MQTSTKSEIRYEEKGHKYFLRDRELPSITKILSKLGLTKSYEGISPFYAERGIATHRAVELDLSGELDEESIDPVIRPFVEAFRKFRKDSNFKPLAIEKIVHTDEYAGRIDWYGMIGDKKWLIDGKCTKRHDPGADFQLCGQAVALGEWPDHMAILELHEDASYTLCEYPVIAAGLTWISVMNLWKRRFA